VEYAKRKNKSWQQADRLVRRSLLPRWAKLRAAAIMRADVKSMMASFSAPIAANQTLAAASAIFSFAIREEMAGVTVNPCVGVERNETSERDRVLNDSEIPRFWAAFGNAGLVTSNVLKVILLSGQRPGEVCAMRVEHVADGWWALPGAPIAELKWPGTKNKQSHRVWLSAPVQDIVKSMGTTGFVFAGARVPTLGVAMRAICKSLEVKNAVKPHDLRRTNGTTITSLGFGRAAMNRVQNHKEGGVGGIYDRYQYSEENKRVMEAVAVRIMALVEGAPVKKTSSPPTWRR
jgi:integrase